MAKPLVFQFGDTEIALTLKKIDRDKLYGFKELEAVDDEDHTCELATLADDGRTLIGKGGTGLGWLDADGQWCDKSALTPHNVDGDPIEPVPSSFSAPVKLFDSCSVEDYLDHNIRLLYRLDFGGKTESPNTAENLDALLEELGRGTIFKFPYSYRGGLEADVGFLLLSAQNEIMMLVGSRSETSLVGLQTQVPIQDEAADETTGDPLDFNMI